MVMMLGPITQRDYYELNPALGNSPGDIWNELPSFGLLPFKRCHGIVITPACDLANRKAETITYLPVIPVLDWFKTVAFLPELRRTLDGQWKFIETEPLLAWPDGYRLPELSTIRAAKEIVSERLTTPSLGNKERTALDRIRPGLELIEQVLAGKSTEVASGLFASCIGEKRFREILAQITANSYRPDLHFLPADRQTPEWTGLPCHSVVLFRYPLTAPVDLFDAAQDIGLSDWASFVKSMEVLYPVASAFAEHCPSKRIRVKPPFISDLLARYVGLNVRLGSPDFTDETIVSYVDEMTKTEAPK